MKQALGCLYFLLALAVCSAALGQEDFSWSWEKRRAANTETNKVPVPVPAVKKPPAVANGQSGITVGAYQELLQENVELRQKLAKQTRESEALKGEKSKLAGDLREMDQKLATFAETMKRLQDEKDEALAKAAGAEAAPAALDAADDLMKEITALRTLVAEFKEQQAKPVSEDAIRADSMLYKELQRKAFLLEEKLVQVDEEREKAVRLSEHLALRCDRIRQQSEETERELRIEISELKTRLSEKEAAVRIRTKEVEALEKALSHEKQRVVQLLAANEQVTYAKESVEQVTDEEQRDMHYNMGVVYAKEGKFSEAEKEYLMALKYDPSDPDLHYNLGVLYDDDLKMPDKAAVHYRRYLRLAPKAADMDAVREWLMRIEMSLNRR